MPSRWWVPLPDVRPEFVKLNHIHAAVSGWFDRTEDEHRDGLKPYALSPLSRERGSVGLEIGTLSDEATRRLHEATAPGTQIRLGNQIRDLRGAQLLHTDSWENLAAHTGDECWTLEFLTPTTFRSGDRASPLPHAATILRSLARAWDNYSPLPRQRPDLSWTSVWVSDLDLRSEVVEIVTQARATGARLPVTVSGSLGVLTLRCDDRETAAAAGPLLALAAYAGVGSMTRKGLGVTRVHIGTSREPEALR
jgi:CRISPR-associated endoribonuclease Cas6